MKANFSIEIGSCRQDCPFSALSKVWICTYFGKKHLGSKELPEEKEGIPSWCPLKENPNVVWS